MLEPSLPLPGPNPIPMAVPNHCVASIPCRQTRNPARTRRAVSEAGSLAFRFRRVGRQRNQRRVQSDQRFHQRLRAIVRVQPGVGGELQGRLDFVSVSEVKRLRVVSAVRPSPRTARKRCDELAQMPECVGILCAIEEHKPMLHSLKLRQLAESVIPFIEPNHREAVDANLTAPLSSGHRKI